VNEAAGRCRIVDDGDGLGVVAGGAAEGGVDVVGRVPDFAFAEGWLA
jgi:hypothetical protein